MALLGADGLPIKSVAIEDVISGAVAERVADARPNQHEMITDPIVRLLADALHPDGFSQEDCMCGHTMARALRTLQVNGARVVTDTTPAYALDCIAQTISGGTMLSTEQSADIAGHVLRRLIAEHLL